MWSRFYEIFIKNITYFCRVIYNPVFTKKRYALIGCLNLVIVNNGSPCIILFLTWLSGVETQINRWKPHRSIAAPMLWYCDVTQTAIVTSFGPIVMRTFPSGSRASSHRRQADYHSLIIENYSRRFRWLENDILQWVLSSSVVIIRCHYPLSSCCHQTYSCNLTNQLDSRTIKQKCKPCV